MQTHDYFIYKNDNVFNIKGFHRDRKKLFEEQWSIYSEDLNSKHLNGGSIWIAEKSE